MNQEEGMQIKVGAARKIKPATRGAGLRVSPDSRWLAVVGETGKWWELIELPSGRSVMTCAPSGSRSGSLPQRPRFAAKAERLVAPRATWEAAGVNPANDAALWDFSGRLLQVFGRPGTGTDAAAVAPDGSRVYTAARVDPMAGLATEILSWDAAGGGTPQVLAQLDSLQDDMEVSADGRTLYTQSNKTVRALSTDSGKELWQFHQPSADRTAWYGLALSPDQRWLALTSVPTVQAKAMYALVLDATTGQVMRELVHPTGNLRRPSCACPACFVGAGLLATVAQNSTLCLWDLANGKLVWSLTDKKVKIGQIDATPDGTALLAKNMGTDGLLLWSVGKGA